MIYKFEREGEGGREEGRGEGDLQTCKGTIGTANRASFSLGTAKEISLKAVRESAAAKLI